MFFENHLYSAQYFINIGCKDACTIKKQQQGDKLLVPKHISIRWQKLDPKFDNLNDILVNSYNPDDPV